MEAAAGVVLAAAVVAPTAVVGAGTGRTKMVE
jgi:hypothetical protein